MTDSLSKIGRYNFVCSMLSMFNNSSVNKYLSHWHIAMHGSITGY